jgi:SAM-dependent methyltransferase
MWAEADKQDMLERYEAQFAQYGYDIRSLFWVKGRQDIRFRVLAEIGICKGASVLDVGCGFGHLLDYLATEYAKVHYTGVDIVPAFVDMAREHHPGSDFRVLDILQDPIKETWDYVVVSGLFNLRLASGENQPFVEAMLRRMHELCNVGIAADFMSTYVDYQLPTSFHADPTTMFQYCRTLSKRVCLRHDYMPYEFAVYVYKDDTIDETNVFAAHHRDGVT